MKNKLFFYPFSLIFLVIILVGSSSFAQTSPSDPKLGHFALGAQAAFGPKGFVYEKPHLGYSLSLKYFNSEKGCFSINHTQLFSGIESVASSRKYSLSLGGERHFVVGRFSPYLGLEGGLNFIAVSSDYLKGGQNEYFINNIPLYLFRPKLGVNVALNQTFAVNLEYVYQWSAHLDRDSLNELFVNAETAYAFSRKTPYIGLGLLVNFGQD
jgi:hypothetical protein